MEVESAKLIAAAICMGVGALGAALGEGLLAARAMEGIGRNPEASSRIFSSMVIGMSIIESTAIFALVVSLIILFAA